jgi:hypothetical protein
LKTNTSRPPKVSAAIRAGAALCVFIWVTGTALCCVERLCDCAGHDRTSAGHAPPAHDHGAVAAHEHGHSQDAGHHHDNAEAHEHAAASHHHDDGAAQGDHGCKGKKCNDNKRCCSTIQALVVTPTPIVIAKPVTTPALIISLLRAAREHALTTPTTKALRQSQPRDWVFTPEVCLGPALHSLAPPAFI